MNAWSRSVPFRSITGIGSNGEILPDGMWTAKFQRQMEQAKSSL
jgi:hypothetical protein